MTATGVQIPPTARRECSPSARLVYVTLAQADAALTVGEIRDQTAVSTDRVRRSLRHLADVGLISTHTHPVDGRVSKYLANASGAAEVEA